MEKKNTLVITILAVVVLFVLVLTATFAYFAATIQGVGNNGNVVNVNAATPASDTSFIVKSSGEISITVTAGDMISAVSDNSTAKQSDQDNLTITLSGGTNSTVGIVSCTYDVAFEWVSGSDNYLTPSTGLTTGAKEFTLEIGNATQTGDCAATPVSNDTKACSNGNVTETNIASSADNSTLVGLLKNGETKKVLLTGQRISSAGTGSTVVIPITARFYNVGVDQKALASKTYKGRVFVETVVC